MWHFLYGDFVFQVLYRFEHLIRIIRIFIQFIRAFVQSWHVLPVEKVQHQVAHWLEVAFSWGLFEVHLVGWGKQNVALETCSVFVFTNMLTIRGDVFLAETKVYQEDLQLFVCISLDHQVLRLQIVIGSACCVQDLKSIYYWVGHFENEPNINFRRWLVKVLFNIKVKLFHYKVTCNFFVILGFNFVGFIIGIFVLMKVGYNHHAVIYNCGYAWLFFHNNHLLLLLDNTFDLLCQYLIFIRELDDKIFSWINILASENFAIRSFVDLTFY